MRKQNFINQMKSQLNNFYLEKIKMIETKPEYQEYHRRQTKLKDALIEVDDYISSQSSFSNEVQDIKGWKSNRIKFQEFRSNPKNNNHRRKKQAHSCKMYDTSAFSQRNHQTIPFLKGVLRRLESPKPKRQIKTQIKNRTPSIQTKIASQESIQLKKSKVQVKTFSTQKNCQKKTQKKKFQTIDLNSENRIFPAKSLKTTTDYHKIKRKNICNNDMGLVHEKEILQQLIKGAKDQNGGISQKNIRRNTEHFTLRNLLN